MELQLRALVKKSLQEHFQPIRIERCFQKLIWKCKKQILEFFSNYSSPKKLKSIDEYDLFDFMINPALAIRPVIILASHWLINQISLSLLEQVDNQTKSSKSSR